MLYVGFWVELLSVDIIVKQLMFGLQVRIDRGHDLQSPSIAGLYPCGEGAGFAGGIVSAAVDGMRIAQAILNEC